MSQPKVICVGFQKTGTSSLSSALSSLGFSVGQAYSEINMVLDPRAEDADDTVARIAVDTLARHDAIQDSPCPFVFERLDAEYPGSKFILTWREPDSWFRSFERHFGNENTPMRHWMYGVSEVEGNEQTIKDIYVRQNEAIREYFRERPQDFLEMELAAGDGWLELVNFLAPKFSLTFPRKNVGTTRRKPSVPARALAYLRRGF